MSESELDKFKRIAKGLYEQCVELKAENAKLQQLASFPNAASGVSLPHRVYAEAQARGDEVSALRAEIAALRQREAAVVAASTAGAAGTINGANPAQSAAKAQALSAQNSQDHQQLVIAERRKFNDLKTQLYKTLDQEKTAFQQLSAQHAELGERYNKVAAQLTAAREKLNALQTQKAEAENLALELAVEQEKAKGLKIAKQAAEKQIAELTEDILTVKEQNTAIQAKSSLLTTENEQLRRSNEALLLFQRENMQLKQSLLRARTELGAQVLRPPAPADGQQCAQNVIQSFHITQNSKCCGTSAAPEAKAPPEAQTEAINAKQSSADPSTASDVNEASISNLLTQREAEIGKLAAPEALYIIAQRLRALKEFAALLREHCSCNLLSTLQTAQASFAKLSIIVCNQYDDLNRLKGFNCYQQNNQQCETAKTEPEPIPEPFSFEVDEPVELLQNAESSMLQNNVFLPESQHPNQKTSRISRIAHLQRDSPRMLQLLQNEEISQEAGQSCWLQHIQAEVDLLFQFAQQKNLSSRSGLHVLRRMANECDSQDLNQLIQLANVLLDEQQIVFESLDELLSRP